jgi:hypothetical protein
MQKMKRYLNSTLLSAFVGASLLLAISPQHASAERRGLFVGDQYYNVGADAQTRARNSKFTTLFLFTLQVNSDGSLRFNDHPVVNASGGWTAGTWGSRIAGCRGGSVNRIELAIGNWGSTSFDNIRNLINAGRIGDLRRNFQTLFNNVSLNAVQMDDEKTYDRTTMVRFCKMLRDDLDMWVTLCPYTNQAFWAGVKADLPNRVTGVYLQCYDGGAGNSATQWRTALGNTSILYPGDWIFAGGTAVTNRMRTWHDQGFPGGFIWGDNRLPDSTWGQWLINAGF